MTKKTKNKYNHYTEDFRRDAVVTDILAFIAATIMAVGSP